jgi:hypothetical protein
VDAGEHGGVDDRRLGVYLNDHLAGAVGGEELAKRCLGQNRDSLLGTYLEQLLDEVREDRATLERLMDELRIARDPWKRHASWLLEKAGRMKLNGGVFGYSDLSRLEELEGLSLGVEGKAMMWRALRSVPSVDERARDFDMAALERRAEGQRERLEVFRREAAERLLKR